MSAETLAKAYASTASVLANITPAQLDHDTPCDQWKVRDVINHLCGAASTFAVVAESGSPPAQSETTDFASGDFQGFYRAKADAALAAFGADGAMDRTMEIRFGELPGSTVATIAAFDTFTHGWDLAKATGQSTDLDAALAAELLASAQKIISPALRASDGTAPFYPPTVPAAEASAADQLAAFMGRNT